MRWIGLDIGGANIKFAFDARHFHLPFELWRQPDQLGNVIQNHLPKQVADTNLAVTMTGELADCFQNRESGVCQIVDQVEKLGLEVVYYQTNGDFVDACSAKSNWQLTAASNWHALACWLCGQFDFVEGFVIDIGSTTTDVIPVAQSKPVSEQRTDRQRLTCGELIYTGTSRSWVGGLVDFFVVDGEEIPVANELFATIDDALLVAGWVPESVATNTADCRPRKMENAAQRLCRMICVDLSEVGIQVARELAIQVIESQKLMIRKGIERVLADHPDLAKQAIVSGSGGHLYDDLLEAIGMRTLNVCHELSPEVAACAPATAVRYLAMH